MLGEEAFTALWTEGQTIGLDQAIEYPLSKEETATSTFTTSEQLSASGSKEETPLLTCREREVAILAARGLKNQLIAEELSISERTVSTHISRVLHKLGLCSRAQITASILEQPPEN